MLFFGMIRIQLTYSKNILNLTVHTIGPCPANTKNITLLVPKVAIKISKKSPDCFFHFIFHPQIFVLFDDFFEVCSTFLILSTL